MPAHRPPYWFWALDRWNLLVTALLLAAVLVAGLRGQPTSQPAFIIPTFTAPAPGAQLPAAAPGDATGTAGPGETVRLFAGDRQIGETHAGADGTFRFTLPPLAAGEHELLARTFGPDGVLRATSAPLKITAVGEMAAAPAAPGEPGPTEPESRATPTPLAPPAIVESGAQVTPTASVEPGISPPPIAPAEAPAPTAPSFIGLAEGAVLLPADLRAVDGVAAPDTRVGILEGGTVAAETVADAAGKWQVDLSGLAPGLHTLVAVALDAGGIQGAASAPVTFTVLTLGRPAFLQPAIPWVVVQGTPVEIRGTATPGATVRLFIADQPSGDVAAGPNGTWRVLLPGLSPGEHVLTIGALYGDGRLLMGAEPLVITVLPLEALPILIHPADGGRMHSCQPLLIGHALPERQVSIYDFQTLLGHALPEADGRWAFRLDTPLALGLHTVTVVAVVDAAGHELQSRPVTFRVETSGVPCLQAGRVAPVLESPAPGSAVSSERPLLLGTATPNSVLRIYDGIQLLGEAQADADGRWVFRPGLPLTPGRHRLILVPMAAYDKEGNPRMQLDLEIAAP